MRLSNKVAVVTAAGQGIGKASALLFASQGAKVHACDINASALEALAKEHDNITTHVIDATDQAFIHTLRATEAKG